MIIQKSVQGPPETDEETTISYIPKCPKSWKDVADGMMPIIVRIIKNYFRITNSLQRLVKSKQ